MEELPVDPQDVENLVEATRAIHEGDPLRIVGLVIFVVLILAVIFLWRRLIVVESAANERANQWIARATELETRSFTTLQDYLNRRS